MRLVSFHTGTASTFGVLVDDGIISAAALHSPHRTLQAAIAAGALTEISAASATLSADLAIEDVRLEPVIPEPGKILCAGVNYRSHRDEAGRDAAATPTIFIRFADSQLAAGADIVCPPAVTKLDYEGEVAAVIGVGGQNIPAHRALDHVAGYACYNDFSARDWQRHSTQWTAGKNFPGTGAFGPFLRTIDDAPALSDMKIQTRVNGEARQDAALADLIFDVPELIAYISAFTPLAPGDVVVTGTPGGVGLFRDPPSFLRPGDIVEVEATGLGVLVNRVAAA